MATIPVEILAKDVACTLDGADVEGRAAEWRALVARATLRARREGSVTLGFPVSDGTAAAVADLAERELVCCAFFAFTIRIADGEVTLEVRAPAEAEALLDALFVF